MNVLSPGLSHSQSILVVDTLTVPALSTAFLGFSEMPPVFATAFMVGFIEWACIEALRGHLLPGQITVGTHIDVTHQAATPVGLTVTANVQLVKVNGRKLCFAVECCDDRDLVGRGFHERTILDSNKFAARLTQKSAACA